MKEHIGKWFVSLAVVFAFGFCCVGQTMAFDTVTCGDQRHTVYGWVRNNLGFFTEYNEGSDLATNRTWARLYLDSKISDKLSIWVAAQAVFEPEYDVEESAAAKSQTGEWLEDYHEYDQFEDVIRELYFDYRFNKSHSLRVGRQIVIWGESLTTRVGDVIHPDNGEFTFAFANLEDTRIPQWIIKGTHDFAGLGSSVEWLVNPNWVDEEYRVNKSHLKDTSRFGIPTDNVLIGMDMFGAFMGGYNLIPHVEDEHVEDSLDDLRYGAKTSTFLGGAEFGVMFFHTQTYDPSFERGARHTFIPGVLYQQDYNLIHPDIDIIGAYANLDIPLGLLRAEAIYIPNKPFMNLTEADAWSRENYFKYMLAWDLNGYFYFDWHKSAPFDITVEHVGEVVPDNDDLQFATYGTEIPTWRPNLGCRISTNWFYNILATEVVFSYTWGEEGDSGLFMPIVKWTPSWNNDMFSAELRYIGIFGDEPLEDLGMFKDRDMVVLTTQINF